MSPIVIADDDADDIFFATRALKKSGIAAPILTCNNGREVIELLRTLLTDARAVLPRVVFLDIKMPQMGGFDALKWIRAQERLREMPVIMLSGSKETRDTELAHFLGADGYLVKYPGPEELARAAAIRRVRHENGDTPAPCGSEGTPRSATKRETHPSGLRDRR